MKLAFCLFKYFPYGGLQRDFFRIARTAKERGHEIHVYTMSWEGPKEPGFNVHILPVKSRQNHTRAAQFAEQLKLELTTHPHDVVIGFNKLPHLDWYYAADVCYQARIRQLRSCFYRLLPRYQRWAALEKATFAQGHKTKIMLISALQLPEYQKYYQTEAERFYLLPPGIAKERIAPPNAETIRQAKRQEWKMAKEDFLLLMVGSGFKTKGLDRTLFSIAALPPDLRQRCQLFVLGKDRAQPFQKLANQLKISEQVHFLGGRDDVADFMLAADILLHPAYHENTGTVLLEAMISGLPVLTVDICGYAHYVTSVNVGKVLPSPFSQNAFNQALEKMLLSTDFSLWRANGLRFGKEADIYALPEKAVNLIEHIECNDDSLSA